MSKTILLVDDEAEIVFFLENFLRRMKISSVRALSGEEALEQFDRHKVDFVFLDVQMKGIDGFTVLGELKRRKPDVQVIMITGRAESEFQNKAKDMGAVDYITKPLDLSELKEKVNRYILS